MSNDSERLKPEPSVISRLLGTASGSPTAWSLSVMLALLYAWVRIMWLEWPSYTSMTFVTILVFTYGFLLLAILCRSIFNVIESQGWSAPAFAGGGMFLLWWWLDGLPSAFLIVACLIGAAIMIANVIRLVTGRYLAGVEDERRYSWYTFLAVVSVGWLAYSAIDSVWSQQPLAISRRAPDHQFWRGSRLAVGVTLSGGGYRAALVHAGVLEELHTRGVPVTHLSTVSGGSIIGMFYTLGHDPQSFVGVVSSGAVRLRRRLLNAFDVWQLPLPITILGKELLPFGGRNRVDLQADILQRIFGRNPPLSELPGQAGVRPWLQLGSTDLITGSVVGVSADGTIVQRVPCRVVGAVKTAEPAFSADGLREENVSLLVAASGAFPGAFGAVKRHGYILSDGGLTDNRGGCALEARQTFQNGDPQTAGNLRSRWRTDLVIVSDAGAEIGQRSDISALGELQRALDVVYAGSGWHPGEQNVLLAPMDVGGSLQRAFQRADTLKDSYTDGEAQELFELGRQMVMRRWPAIKVRLDGVAQKSGSTQ